MVPSTNDKCWLTIENIQGKMSKWTNKIFRKWWEFFSRFYQLLHSTFNRLYKNTHITIKPAYMCMSMYMYVCMCICVHICMYVYMYVRMYMYVYMLCVRVTHKAGRYHIQSTATNLKNISVHWSSASSTLSLHRQRTFFGFLFEEGQCRDTKTGSRHTPIIDKQINK